MSPSIFKNAQIDIEGLDSDCTDAEEQELLLEAGIHKLNIEKQPSRWSKWLLCILVLAGLILIAACRGSSSHHASDDVGSIIQLNLLTSPLDNSLVDVGTRISEDSTSTVTSMIKDGMCKDSEKDIKDRDEDEKGSQDQEDNKNDGKNNGKAPTAAGTGISCAKDAGDLLASIGNSCAEVAAVALQPRVDIACGPIAIAAACISTAYDKGPSLESLGNTLHEAFQRIGKSFQMVERTIAGLQSGFAGFKNEMLQEPHSLETYLKGLERTMAQEEFTTGNNTSPSVLTARKGLQTDFAAIMQNSRTLSFAYKLLLTLDFKAGTFGGFCPSEISNHLPEFSASLTGRHLKQLIKKQVELKFPHQKSMDLGNIFLVSRNYLFFYEVACAVIRKDSRTIAKLIVPRYNRDMKEYRESIFMTYSFDKYLASTNFKPPSNITGDLKDIPKVVTTVKSIDLSDNHKVAGELKDFSKSVTTINLASNPVITGSFADLPKHLTSIDLSLNQQIAGDIQDLPKSVIQMNLANNVKITGELKDLPKSVTDINLAFTLNVRGDIKDLPKGLIKVNLAHNWMITGDIRDLPSSVTDIDLSYNRIITGDLKNLPKAVTNINLAGTEMVTGELKDLPKLVTNISLASNEKITGGLKDLPKLVSALDLSYNERIKGDLQDLPTSMTYIDLTSNDVITGVLSNVSVSCVQCTRAAK